jgi:hypothetical protein
MSNKPLTFSELELNGKTVHGDVECSYNIAVGGVANSKYAPGSAQEHYTSCRKVLSIIIVVETM